MGLISLDTKYGPINVEIEGDTPTIMESQQIEKIYNNPKSFLPESLTSSPASSVDPSFDTKTGVRDTKLRSALSFADTGTEEEAVLQKFGLQEGQYLRDNRGRLALSPEGAQVFGIDTDKNILIDESGFSMSDFTDLAGLVPEIGGAVAGAIAGQAAIPIPILGAMIGAGIGGGGGNLLEEAGEGIAGTSRQTAGEIAKQTATEAAIAAAGEGIVGSVARMFGAIRPYSKGLDTEARELVDLSRGMGIDPSANLMGAPSMISRQQRIGEKIHGTSPRLVKNHDSITRILGELREKVGSDDPEALGKLLKQAGKSQKDSLLKIERQASKDLLKNMQEIADDVTKAATDDTALDDDLLKAFVGSFKAFDAKATEKYATIDVALKDAVGDKQIFDTVALKNSAKAELTRIKQAKSPDFEILEKNIKGIIQLPDNASLAQIFNVRKAWRDGKILNANSDTFRRAADDVVTQLDAITSPSALELMVKPVDATKFNYSLVGGKAKYNILKNAVDDVGEARQFYTQGLEKFEALQDAGILKELKRKIRLGEKIDSEGLATSLIKPNKASIFNNLSKAFDEKDIGAYERFRQRIADDWVKKTLQNSLDPTDPSKFKGSHFINELEKLKNTGPKLFGEDFAKLKSLGNQVNSLKLKNVDINVVDAFVNANANKNSQQLLQNLIKAQEDLKSTGQTLNELAKGKQADITAAKMLVKKSTTSNDIDIILKQFDGTTPGLPRNEEALSNIKSYFMKDVIGDFGDNFLIDPKQYSAFSGRLTDAYSSGKLKSIYGKELAEKMNNFAKVLKFNSKTAEGGDLVAANIAASPLQNIPKLLKFSILGRIFSSELFYKSFDEAIAKKVGFGDAFKKAITQFIAQQTDAGIEEGKKQAKAIIESERNKPNKSLVSTPIPMPNVTPPAPGSSLSNINPTQAIVNAASNIGPAPIRQRASQNPAVATSLLGGLGSASLLNR